MRKVYHSEQSVTGLAVAIFFAVGLTALLFGTLPFAHRIANPDKGLELVTATTTDLPPPPKEEELPPVMEDVKPPDAPPDPVLTEVPQQIPISADLEVALGSGGALAGFGAEFHSPAAVEQILESAFDVAELEKRPEPISQPAPTYPPELKKAKIEGVVTLVFVLNEEGRVEDPRVENASRPEFEKPALEAVRKWRFRPGEKDGKAVRTYIKQPLRFRVGSG